ncbi:MAG: Na/Pi cotransporter family protein [Clostridiales bacterium]|nr:Na/Pi cotransporter family protein [Clostridiales bacterium]
MNGITVTTSILTLIAGLGVFLVACSMMSSNLESLGSKRLKALFSKTSNSKLLGVGIGTVATAAIQSSGATSVMVIGFVNAGIMTLTQAATIMFGANIGTTITGQLVALGMFGDDTLSTSVVFAAFAGIGAFITLFTKKDTPQKIGRILSGFGMIFVGLSLMSKSMDAFADSPAVRGFLAGFTSPILLVLIGLVLTAIVQSSSVLTSMAIAMIVAKLIDVNQGIYITLGANIGACVTTVIAGFTSGRNAKRAALIRVIFNVAGVAIFMLIGLFLRLGHIDFGYLMEAMFPGAYATQLAMFHTFFNVISVAIVLPMTGLLVKLVTKIIPEPKQKEEDNKPHLYFVDEHLLRTPPIAVLETKNEIVHMAQIAMENFHIAMNIISTLDYSEVDKFRANEEQLNFLNRELVVFIVKLLQCELGVKDRTYLTRAVRSIADFERIGDYAENIVEFADILKENNSVFSEKALNEINELRALVDNLFEKVMKGYKEHDRKALSEANDIEDNVDDFTAAMGKHHVKRLREGVCTPEVGAQYLSLSTSVERIADHLINVAQTVKR